MRAKIHNFRSREQFDDFVQGLADISFSDTSFRMSADKEAMEIRIECDDRDALHKKCVWFVKNLDKGKTAVYDVEVV